LFALCIKLGWKATKYIFTGWLLLILLYSFHIFSSSLLLVQTVLSPLNIQILTGCLAGYFFTKNSFRIKTSVFIYLIVSIAILTMAFIYWKGIENSNLFFTTMVGIASSLIIFYTASLDKDKLSKNIGSSLLVLIGDASYSIFLTHILFIPYICIALNKVLNVPVILVSRNTLGSINFSLLTAMACKQKNINVTGWIFNDNYLNYEHDIAKWSGIPSLSSIPFAPHPDSDFIKEQAEKIKKQMDNWPW